MRLSLSSPRQLAALAAAATALLSAAGPANAVQIVGLTRTNALTTFDSSSPTNGSTPIFITGLDDTLNERILGIDLRPTTGVLYGISSDSKLYTLNPVTAMATKVANLTTTLSGVAFGVDFNPVADTGGLASLRVTSDSGQNLAVRVAPAGAIPAGTTTPQTPLTFNGAPIGAAAVAYNNNDTDPNTLTTLFYIDDASSALYRNLSAPPGGMLTSVGALGINITGVAGFDIAGAGNAAFAALSVDGSDKSSLYSINLTNGMATSLGAFGILGNTAIAPQLLGLAVTAVPEPSTYALMLAGLAAVGAAAKRRKA